MKHGTIRNDEKYCDTLAVNVSTHILPIQFILTTTRGTAVSCDTWEHIAAVPSCPIKIFTIAEYYMIKSEPKISTLARTYSANVLCKETALSCSQYKRHKINSDTITKIEEQPSPPSKQ